MFGGNPFLFQAIAQKQQALREQMAHASSTPAIYDDLNASNSSINSIISDVEQTQRWQQEQTPTRKSEAIQHIEGRRRRLSPEETAVLGQHFRQNERPAVFERARIARMLNLTERTVQIWFQNRRAKQRKESTPASGARKLSLAGAEGSLSTMDATPVALPARRSSESAASSMKRAKSMPMFSYTAEIHAEMGSPMKRDVLLFAARRGGMPFPAVSTDKRKLTAIRNETTPTLQRLPASLNGSTASLDSFVSLAALNTPTADLGPLFGEELVVLESTWSEASDSESASPSSKQRQLVLDSNPVLDDLDFGVAMMGCLTSADKKAHELAM